MELSKESFRKIILVSIGFFVLSFGLDSIPLFSNYEILEEQLHQGYLHQWVSPEIRLIILLFPIVLWLIGLFLLYWFKPIGRTVYLISYITTIIVLILSGDWIQYSLSYPLEVVSGFLEIFILYLIYLTPLKNEFENN